jgi:hypothetical protein
MMYGTETWWNGSSATPPSGQGGYGVSKFFASPPYQASLNSSAMRSVPDVVVNADPVQGITTTVLWRDPFINLPEQTLIGVMYTAQNVASYNNPPDTYVVTNSSNWVYAGTGFADGSTVPHIVGYEVDRYQSQYPSPVSVSGTYVLLSHSPVVDVNFGNADYANSSIYQAPSGAWVFGAGTVDWGWGLSRSGFIDARIQQTTNNILNRFIASTNSSPVIVSQSPPGGATGVSTGTIVSVTFSHAMLASTFTSSTFTLQAAGTSSNVAASITVSGATATLTPSSALAASTTYTATVAGTVTDINGIALGTTATWTFTTQSSAGMNLLVSPNDITNPAWQVYGSGCSVTNANTLTYSASSCTLYQVVNASPNTAYTASVTVTLASGKGDYVTNGLFTTSFSSLCTSSAAVISSTPSVKACTVSSGANTKVQIEIDTGGTAAGSMTISGATIHQ